MLCSILMQHSDILAATLEATLLAAIKIGSNVEAIDANSIALVKELQGHNSAVIKQVSQPTYHQFCLRGVKLIVFLS